MLAINKLTQIEAINNVKKLKFPNCQESKTEVAILTDCSTLESLPKEFFTKDEEFIYSNLLVINRNEHALYGVVQRIVRRPI